MTAPNPYIPPTHEPIIDAEGQCLTIGSRVIFEAVPRCVYKTRLYGPNWGNPSLTVYTSYAPQPEAFGVVTDISDVDGDVDDEGRSITIYPHVTVSYCEDSMGADEIFSTHWTGRWQDDDAPFQAEDLRLAP